MKPAFGQQFVRSFWGWRVWSEFVARRESTCEDIDLAAIYRTLSCLCALEDHVRDSLYKLELQVEYEMLTPIRGTAELLHECRCRSNHGIVFVSDMYLPSWYIRSVLEKFAMFREGDLLYVSGESGVTKGSGKLFRLVLDDLGLTPGELVHFGDNPHADQAVPKSLGIGLLNETPHLPSLSIIDGLKLKFLYLRDLIRARLTIIMGGENV